MTETVSISGREEIRAILGDIAPKHARNLMRSTSLAIAKRIAVLAKEKVPKETGTLKKAIKARRRKSHPDHPIAGVYVTHGEDAKHDAYYWRFVEYGTRGKWANDSRPFLRPASQEIKSRHTEILIEEFGKKLEALLRRRRGV